MLTPMIPAALATLTLVTNAAPPSAQTPHAGPKTAHAMCVDAARGELVLFGGRRDGEELGETWVRRGGRWTRAFQSDGPCARHGHAMAWDAARERVVLFGGRASGAELGDTWEWDGHAWRRLEVSAGPAPRRLHAMAYDPMHRRVVLFGGVAQGRGMFADTWVWEDASWRRLRSESSPPKRIRPSLSFDTRRGALVLSGGYGRAKHLRDAWRLGAARWDRVLPYADGAPSMCRNIKTLFNFEPPATHDEVRAAALQFVRKLSGFAKPSQQNAAVFDDAVREVTEVAERLLAGLQTKAAPKDREVEAEKARARNAKRFGAKER